MSSTALLGFTLIALLTVVTPGLDSMLVVRHSLVGGRRSGVAVVLGTTAGCLIWATASLAGLTALLTASRLAYDIVRILGAIYLVWLGTTMLWKTIRHRHHTDAAAIPTTKPGLAKAFRAGLGTNLLNPKPGVFYMSLLPQFLPGGPANLAWGLLLVAIHLAIGLVWLPLLAWTADRARHLFARARLRRWLDRVTATVLIGLGVKLAVEAR
ncbi:MAG TPA: LysE family translocator [Actinophytocola sp.]|jgi:threonine/homoserine/homoserine lactone efflux protein|uniref:LysE family translocator n=1 Tax=Actinophytocola sp. TaxID=1872138 RepID=UPI002E0ADD01|nr:LysE family translocator [Actinophytocola sp.]